MKNTAKNVRRLPRPSSAIAAVRPCARWPRRWAFQTMCGMHCPARSGAGGRRRWAKPRPWPADWTRPIPCRSMSSSLPTRSWSSRAISPSMSAASSSPRTASTRSCRSSRLAMEARKMVEWDKDDLDHVGILKVDVLALGMLSCLRRAFELLTAHYEARNEGERIVDFNTMPKEDERVYDMICRADTLGVFQIELRAQMSMLPRLQPRNSTIWSSRWRSSAPDRSRATWCIPICAGRGWSRKRSSIRAPEMETILGENAWGTVVPGAGDEDRN